MTTEEDIITRINARLTIEANKIGGGFSQDIIGSVAYELANIEDVEIPQILDSAFVTTATGDDLDKVGADYQYPRKEDAPAVVYLKITGTQNAVVDSTIKAQHNNLVYQVTEYAVIGSSGTVTVKAQCLTDGTVGNLQADTITEFVATYTGLTAVTNPEPAYDGFDRESDDIYRARLIMYLAEDATNANEAQYKQWALSVSGVSKAVVQDASIMGAGNVGVYIYSETGTPSADLITKVKTYIESVQPINATLTVDALTEVALNVSADVELKSGYTTADVKDEFTEKFESYINSVSTVVSYLKISDLLFECVGVSDVNSYTLNGGTTSISLTSLQVGKVGTIVIS